MAKKKIRVKLTGKADDTVYISFAAHRHEPGCVARTIDLAGIIPNYIGPKINIDIDHEGRTIGVEILVYGSD